MCSRSSLGHNIWAELIRVCQSKENTWSIHGSPGPGLGSHGLEPLYPHIFYCNLIASQFLSTSQLSPTKTQRWSLTCFLWDVWSQLLLVLGHRAVKQTLRKALVAPCWMHPEEYLDSQLNIFISFKSPFDHTVYSYYELASSSRVWG